MSLMVKIGVGVPAVSNWYIVRCAVRRRMALASWLLRPNATMTSSVRSKGVANANAMDARTVTDMCLKHAASRYSECILECTRSTFSIGP